MTDPSPQRWAQAFAACKQDAEALTQSLSPAAFNASPSAGAWSAGQCLDHLLEAGQPVAARVRAALADAPAAQEQPGLGLLDRLFVWAVQPGSWLKMPSPGAYRPSESVALDPERIGSAFRALQDELAACAEAAAGRDWSVVKVPSPANRFVRLSAGGWLEGTLAHQQRHLRQAQRAATGAA